MVFKKPRSLIEVSQFGMVLVHCQADFDGFKGVQSEALRDQTKLSFELQPTKQCKA
jgi:hypothetical protein